MAHINNCKNPNQMDYRKHGQNHFRKFNEMDGNEMKWPSK